MFCRKQATISIRLSALAGLAALFLATASSVCGEDFRILLVRDGDMNKERQLPAGEVVVQAGYVDGVDVGGTGTIWRKNKYKGQIDIADLEVISVSAYEATCRYTMRHPDFFVLKKDRVALEPHSHSEAEILAKAIESLGHGECFDALLLFESIICATLDNAFVQQQTAECRRQVERRLALKPTAAEAGRAGITVRDYLELAERHHKFKNDLVADLYLKRIAVIDADNAKATALRESVPVQDYATLLSAARCE